MLNECFVLLASVENCLWRLPVTRELLGRYRSAIRFSRWEEH
jgi:hypothetical protein